MNLVILSCYIAGLSHYGATPELCAEGTPVRLIPEPSNEFDPRAIKVTAERSDGAPVQLGHIPRESTLAIHTALKNNFVPSCIITKSDFTGRHPKVTIVATVNV